jgi:flagellar hook-associated protein 3 FlgL
MTVVSTLAQALNQVERIKQQQLLLGDLQVQVATGKKSQLYEGLGVDVKASISSRSDINKLDTYVSNIDRGQTRVAEMVSVLDAIKTQAQNSIDGIAGQPQQGDFDLEILRRIAESGFEFIIDLLNSRNGDTYLFSGGASTTKPISNTGGLDSLFSNLNPQWANGTLPFNPPDSITDEYISQYRDSDNLTDVEIGYDGALNQAKKVFISITENTELDYTIMANDPALRDIVVALATIKNLPNVLDAPPPQGQVVGTVDIEAASFGVDLFTAYGFVDGSDNFEIRFDKNGPLDSGPIVIDLSDVAAAPEAAIPPANSGAEGLVNYINDVIIPNLPNPLNTTSVARLSNGQLVLGAEADIEITAGTMGVSNLASLGLTEGTTSPTNADSKDAFFQVLNDLGAMLAEGIDNLERLQYKLYDVQARMNQTKKLHTFDKSLLQTTVSDAEDIDLNEVATKLNFLQIQLEASFRVTAAVRETSLLRFI